MQIDTTRWSGEGEFTAVLLEQLKQIAGIALIRVEDAPATRSEADYNFVSNEVFVGFTRLERREPVRRFGIIPGSRTVTAPAMTVSGLEAALASVTGIGAPDYSDDKMLQYLRAERIVPPYQTKGYKLVELVRIYEVAGEDPDEATKR
jgi:hypothetical protein